ncbi:MAG: shikimate kinase [Desulfobacterales bacterium]|nr:MAG: shikimate kinase [Desulfobacterales bacterium]
MNIYLIGYRATGKTSVAKALAVRLGWPFVDTDLVLVKEVGLTITDFVGRYGWEAFREHEGQVLKKIVASDRQVVATGGGIVLDRENVKQMKNSGVIIWLKASPATIKQRIIQDKNTAASRPSLTSQGLDNEIEETLLRRRSYYENAMDLSIDTDDLPIDEIGTEILNKLNEIKMNWSSTPPHRKPEA